MKLQLALLALAGMPLVGQPVVAYRGVLNAASLTPPGLPNGGIARGSVFCVLGRGLGPAVGATVSAFPLGPQFEGVSVSVAQGGISVSAIPIFVSAGQINAIMPSNTPVGTASLRVTYNGRTSLGVAVEVAENGPGIFAVSSGGFGPGVVQNFVSEGVQPVNSLGASAARGQVITIWATGLGRAPFPDNVAPTARDLEVPVTVTIGERDAVRLYAGRSPCCAGVDQIVVRVPADAPLGCYVPLRIKSGSGVSNTVTMAIGERSGEGCVDNFNPFSNLLRNTRRQGMIWLDRTLGYLDGFVPTTEQNTTESLRAYFWERPASVFAYDPLFSYPPPGSCVVHQTSGNVFRGAPLRGMMAAGAAIDVGGAVRVDTPFAGSTEAGRIDQPAVGYAGVIGSLRANDGVGGLRLDFPNTVTVSYGTVEVKPNATNLFAWSGRAQLDRIRRSVTTRIAFTPNDFGAVSLLSLVGYSGLQDATTAVVCVAAPGVDTFVLSPDLMANLPETPERPDGSLAMLGVGVAPLERAVAFSGSGVERGLLLFTQWQTRTVVLQ
ncbi:MAG: hypothetical protein ACK5TN_09075 [Acidobacteriota bacterium]